VGVGVVGVGVGVVGVGVGVVGDGEGVVGDGEGVVGDGGDDWGELGCVLEVFFGADSGNTAAALCDDARVGETAGLGDDERTEGTEGTTTGAGCDVRDAVGVLVVWLVNWLTPAAVPAITSTAIAEPATDIGRASLNELGALTSRSLRCRDDRWVCTVTASTS
jgi:hypothetical protein